MCRLATDPDPSNEARGRSGYTMALTGEDPLDQVIRLQPDDYVLSNLRAPAAALRREVGVRVTSATLGGGPWVGAQRVLGAKVELIGPDGKTAGAIFESRNNIVGSDDSLAFVITPFDLSIHKDAAEGDSALALRAKDHLNPRKPRQKTWEIESPTLYGRRFPTAFEPASLEVMQAISVFDPYAYFRGRRAFLTGEIDRLHTLVAQAGDAERGPLEVRVQEARSRLYQLEFWGDRVINKLGFRLEWEFDINGKQAIDAELGGRVDSGQPWHVRLWCGGWDGDLLIGYLRGALSMPFKPDPPPM